MRVPPIAVMCPAILTKADDEDSFLYKERLRTTVLHAVQNGALEIVQARDLGYLECFKKTDTSIALAKRSRKSHIAVE